MLPFFAWKIFSISFFISLDFYLQVLLLDNYSLLLYYIVDNIAVCYQTKGEEENVLQKLRKGNRR